MNRNKVFIIEKKQFEQKTGQQQVFDMWENEDDRLTDICVETNDIDYDSIIPRVGDKLYSTHGLFTVVDVIICSYIMDSAIFVVEPVIKRKKI